MNQNFKTVLILLIFVVIVILLFRPSYCDRDDVKTEPFQHMYLDPWVHPYSKDITFRPNNDKQYVLDDTANTNPFKVFSHLADHKKGLHEYDNIYDTEPRNNKTILFREGSRNLSEHELESIKDMRETRDLSREPKDLSLSSKHYKKYIPPYQSSYNMTDLDRDRLNETNNMSRYCCENCAIDTGNNVDAENNNGVLTLHETDRPYASRIDDMLDTDMNINDNEYYKMVTNRPDLKMYIKLDQDYGKFLTTEEGKIQDIDGLNELSSLIDEYKNNTLDTIRGADRNSKVTPLVRN